MCEGKYVCVDVYIVHTKQCVFLCLVHIYYFLCEIAYRCENDYRHNYKTKSIISRYDNNNKSAVMTAIMLLLDKAFIRNEYSLKVKIVLLVVQVAEVPVLMIILIIFYAYYVSW